ncbi:hypothetical protein JJB99_07995 [Bradyrhizobium diazoefficiens]|uniref:hypothetical protein n=1 Tax=Bradyrhizobium diazoefficiens TaxID=1355477 RepID=UPI00190B367F|nr:hypothetical protein [Bradyrhizobium diazoefficiens]QQO16083.1 hypothetical protein JJB99_07995 [Bradyrhizobium diazoefficiens]
MVYRAVAFPAFSRASDRCPMHSREFKKDGFTIKVIAHVPSDNSYQLVDALAITLLDGDEAKAVAFVAELKRIYLGKPVSMWESGELDE